MQVSEAVASWLLALGTTKKDAVSPGRGSGWVLNSENTDAFLNGVGVAELLAELGKLRGIPPPPMKGALKAGESPVARLTNWNTLTPLLQMFGLDVDADTKSLVVVGDTEMMAEVLRRFHERLGAELTPRIPAAVLPPRPKPPRDSGAEQPGVIRAASMTRAPSSAAGSDVSDADSFRGGARAGPRASRGGGDAGAFPEVPGEAETVAGFLCESLQVYFGVDERRAAQLITDGSEELRRWLSAGEAGGRFEGCTAWLEHVGTSARALAGLLVREPEALNVVLPYFAAGISSADEACCFAASHALAALGKAIWSTPLSAPAFDWFVSKDGALPLLLKGMRRQSAAAASAGAGPGKAAGAAAGSGAGAAGPGPANVPPQLVAALLDRLCRRDLRDLFGVHLKRAAASPVEWLDIVQQLLPPLANIPSVRRAMNKDGTASGVASDALPCAEGGPEELRSAALRLLESLWTLYPEAVQDDAEVCRAVLAAFKKAARDGAPPLQIGSLECLFRLLHAFIATGSSFAPMVYKTLIFATIENHDVETVRDAALELMCGAIARQPHIPVGVLVEPLAKRAARKGFCDRDFPLLSQVAQHSRLEPPHAAMLIDVLVPVATSASGDGSGPFAPKAQAVLVLLAPRLYPAGGDPSAPPRADPASIASLRRLAAACLIPFDPHFAGSYGQDDSATASGAPGAAAARALCGRLLLALAQLRHPGVSAALRPQVERRSSEIVAIRGAADDVLPPVCAELAIAAPEALPGLTPEDGAEAVYYAALEDDQDGSVRGGAAPPPSTPQGKAARAVAAGVADEMLREAAAGAVVSARGRKELTGMTDGLVEGMLQEAAARAVVKRGEKSVADKEAARRLAEQRRLHIEQAAKRLADKEAAAKAEEKARADKLERVMKHLRQRREGLLNGKLRDSDGFQRPATPAPTWAQQLIIEALNQRLQKDPDLQLPDGFVRVPVPADDDAGAQQPTFCVKLGRPRATLAPIKFNPGATSRSTSVPPQQRFNPSQSLRSSFGRSRSVEPSERRPLKLSKLPHKPGEPQKQKLGADGYYPNERMHAKFIANIVDGHITEAAHGAVRLSRNEVKRVKVAPPKPANERSVIMKMTPVEMARGPAAVAAAALQKQREDADRLERMRAKTAADKEAMAARAAQLKAVVALAGEARERKEREAREAKEAQEAAAEEAKRRAEIERIRRHEGEKERIEQYKAAKRAAEAAAEAAAAEEYWAKEEAKQQERRRRVEDLNRKGIGMEADIQSAWLVPKHLGQGGRQDLATKRQAEADAAEQQPVRIGARPLGYVPKAVRNAGDPKFDPRIMRADVLAASVMDDLMAQATAGLAFSLPRGKENEDDAERENGAAADMAASVTDDIMAEAAGLAFSFSGRGGGDGDAEHGGYDSGGGENGYGNGDYGGGIMDGGVDEDDGIPKAVAASGYA